MSEVIFMKIYFYVDASPVNNMVIEIATGKKMPVILVKSIDQLSRAAEIYRVETVYVDTGADAADYRIMQLAERGDMLITQDYGLASLGLGKGCTVLHHKGFAYTNDNIDQLLQSRHL